MSDEIYHKLAKVLDTLPSGFPATESGIEIKILKKIFTPEEADLFCDLRLTSEDAEQIAKRTGRSIEGLEEMLISMWKRGEIWADESDGVKRFKMMPWIIGIWGILKRFRSAILGFRPPSNAGHPHRKRDSRQTGSFNL
jgi:hypothetical protein